MALPGLRCGMQDLLAVTYGVSIGKESTCNSRDPSLIPGSGRSTGDRIGYPLQYSWASLVAQLVKNTAAMRETWVNPWIEKIPWRRERLPTPVFWPGEFPGFYSPQGHRDRTLLSNFHFIRSSSLTRHQSQTPALGTCSLSHWTSGQVSLTSLKPLVVLGKKIVTFSWKVDCLEPMNFTLLVKHQALYGHELGQTPGDGEGQGSLACYYSPWGRRVGYDLATEQ